MSTEPRLTDMTHMVHGKTIAFEVASPFKETVLQEDIVDYDVTCSTKSGFFYRERLFRIELEVEVGILLVKKRKPRKAGMIRTEFVFAVDEWGKWIQEVEGELYVHPVFVATLVGVAYSTTRGMLMARAAGTLLEDCIMPLINPEDLIDRPGS